MVEVEALVAEEPSLLESVGPHPYWGGEATAMHVAAEWGRADVVRALLRAGASVEPDSSRYDGWTPLHIALHKDHGPAAHDEGVRLLLEAGAEVDLCAAAAMGDAARVRALLEAGASVTKTGPNGATPLHFASTEEVARILVEKVASVSAVDKYGRTPAAAVASYGNRRKAAAMYLSRLSGDMDAKRAAALGELEILKSFDDRSSELLAVAAFHGQTEVVEWLLAEGVDPNGPVESGVSPLHQAARNGHIETARVLLRHGADPESLDSLHDSTPLGWAEFQGQERMAAFLREGMQR